MLKRLASALAAVWLCLAPAGADPASNFALLPLIQATATTSQSGDGQWQFAFATGSPSTPIDLTGITFDLRWHPAAGGTANPIVISLAAGQYLSNGGPTGVLTLTIPQARLRVLPVGTYVASLVASLSGAISDLGVVTITHAALGSSSVQSLTTTARNAASATTVGFIPGPQGQSAYQAAVANGFSGNLAQWLASLVGPTGAVGPQGSIGPTGATGPQGLTGATGPANTLSIGSVTTGTTGGAAAASITGAAPSQSLNLTLPLAATGTTAGIVAAGNDSRITGALQASTAAAIYAPLNSPALTGIPMAPTPAIGTNTTQIATAAMVTGAVAAIPGALSVPLGQIRLTYTGTTTLTAKPYSGNLIMVGGVYRTVPSAGFTCSNAGQTAATLTYQYTYWTGSALACEVSTTGHVTDPTTGMEIKSGDSSRTLIGIAYMAAGTPGTFSDGATFRGVRSYFNRVPLALRNPVTGSTSSGANASLAGTATLVLWADEALSVRVAGYSSNTAISNNTTTNFLDGAVYGTSGAATVPAASYAVPSVAEGLAAPGELTEGAHTVSVVGNVNAGTGTWSGSQFVNIGR